MKAQSKYVLRSEGHKRPSASQKREVPNGDTPGPVRPESIEQARRRMASGFYDSDLCLNITVRRMARDINRPAFISKNASPLPGRLAEKKTWNQPGKARPGHHD